MHFISQINLLFCIVGTCKTWTLNFYWVICLFAKKTFVSRSSQTPLTLHAWKVIDDKTLFRWRKCTFVLHVRWSLRDFCPWNLIFLCKKLKLVDYLLYREGTNCCVISDLGNITGSKGSRVKVILFSLKINKLSW
jgi:hypothetical protein